MFLCRAPRGTGFNLRPCGPRPLLFFPEAPGSRARTAAYFCRAAKVGKNALEPTVQDSLRRAGACAPLPYTGDKGLCGGFVGKAKPLNI